MQEVEADGGALAADELTTSGAADLEGPGGFGEPDQDEVQSSGSTHVRLTSQNHRNRNSLFSELSGSKKSETSKNNHTHVELKL